MSYTPVREAFKRLEREGLLERIPNVGYLIPRMSKNNIEEIFQVRECLETFVLKKVFNSLSEENIAILENYIKEQKEALSQENIKMFYENDKCFHLLFFEVYGNSHMKDIIKNIRERYSLCSLSTITESKSKDKHGISQAIKEHEKIIDCIKDGNKQKAVESLIKNIRKSRDRLMKGNISLH